VTAPRGYATPLAVIALLILVAAGVTPTTMAQGQAQPRQQTGYVPLGELPPQEQLPAAPLLVAAYVVVIGGLFAYLSLLTRRIATIQRDVQQLKLDVSTIARR
jgi:ABC-type Na+ efflux pump permease subunit